MTHRQTPPGIARPRGKAPIALIAILAVVAIAVVLFFVLRGGGGGAAAKLASAHIPAEAEFVGGVDVQGVLGSEMLKSMMADKGVSLETVTAELAKHGIKLEDIKTVAFGATLGSGDVPRQFVAVGQGTFDGSALKAAIEGAKLAEAAATEGMAMPLTFDQIEVIDPQTVVMGTADFVKKSLGIASGAEQSIDTRPELKDLRAAIDQGASLWMAGPVPEGVGALGALGMMGGGGLGKPTHFAISANVGADIKVRVAIHFASGDAGAVASKVGQLLSFASAMAKGPEADVLSSLDISGSGQVLTASVTLSKAFIAEAAKKGGGGFGLPF